MRIRKIGVQNFRSHDQKVLDLPLTTSLIIGKNGAGKTSLLEAVYVALQGSSFKGSDTDIVKRDAPWWRIDLELDDGLVRTVTFDPSKSSGKKQFTVNGKKSYRLSVKDKYPVVLFEPEDLRLFHGSPSRRRSFIDSLVQQIDPMYGAILRRYDRALKQRNTLLKNPALSDEDLFVWNIALSDLGSKIIEKRIYAIELLNKTINAHYKDIAQTNDELSIHYSHTIIDNSAQKLLRELESKMPYDKVVKYTSIGPHRHDVVFKFNGRPALSIASRGEVRTILLAIKRIEATMIEELTGYSPIVLLDDVFSELDETRQKLITQVGAQQIVTTTSAPDSISEGLILI